MSEHSTIHVGDCLEWLRTLPDASVDSCVTDPPYGLGKEPDPREVLAAWLSDERFKPGGRGFMGKAWDAFVPSPLVWAEVFRVLKPGGPLLAFAGSRTYDWIALGVRLAGFEIRDQLMWIYGSGFPKSHDVSKAIDRRERGKLAARKISYFMGSRGLTAYELAQKSGIKSAASIMDWTVGGHCPSDSNWRLIADALGVTREEEEEYEREIVTRRTKSDRRSDGTTYGLGHSGVADITAPATEAARKWDGWGTALKPAHEPLVWARKPLIGSVAANVLEHGTGAINVDGCRIATKDNRSRPPRTPNAIYGGGKGASLTASESHTQGRWPANIMHEGSAEVVAAFPGEDDASAARFFYSPKASRKEREWGLDALGDYRGTTDDGRKVAADNAYQRGKTQRRNIHPTVKPVALIGYLQRLITPPGGVPIDPYLGSGTAAMAATWEGFTCHGCELDTAHATIAHLRHAYALDNPCPYDQPKQEPEAEPGAQLDIFGGES